ncbi:MULTISPECIES: DUF502 domain-containing protein [Methylocaldum]|jgi:uncharacterized membrane protein|uniref:DUF502 domain-containing protein n=1 Tax=unclassified Methylocaldum TaxID=2622260 RepID=UPI00098A5787|nr:MULTISPECIES: DUF502 domain-containing protein [unclassified Methylocaldum]MBP1150172.1 putative membrane protein [Methylocaldum sp. RMAD-M]MVF24070.1 DUF502 domain-containing protein [Methylocaldum sp. BRCS4]
MKKTLQKFFGYFLIGVLGVLPIVIILQIVIAVEGLLRDFVLSIFGRYENFFIPIGLFTTAILVLTYFGYLLKQDKAHVWYYLEGLLNRIPLLGTIYRVTKKILNLFRGDEKEKLRDVVYIEYPKEGIWVPAYVTNRVDDYLVLYVPTSPNPTSGFTVIVHESKVRVSEMSIEEASSFVISLGVDIPRPNEASRLELNADKASQ